MSGPRHEMHDERNDREEQEQMNHRAGDVKEYERAEPGEHQQNGKSEKYESHELQSPCVLESGNVRFPRGRDLLKPAFQRSFRACGASPDLATFFRGTGFARRGNVLRSGVGEDFLRGFDLRDGNTVNREEDSALLQATFVDFGFVFGNSKSDQCAREASNGSANADARKGSDERAEREKRADTGNGQRAQPGEQAERSADRCAGCGSGRSAFGSLRGFFYRDVGGAGGIFRQKDGEIGGRETGIDQLIRGLLACVTARVNPEDGNFFVSHVSPHPMKIETASDVGAGAFSLGLFYWRRKRKSIGQKA